MSSTSLPPVRWPPKDPDERLDYKLNWAGTRYNPGPLYGSSDTISNSLWVVPAGLSSDLEEHDTTSTTIWLSGGTAGESYELLNRITTAEDRVFDQTVILAVKDK